MQFRHRWLFALALMHAAVAVEAQIYTCTAKDGTRIFSDEKCGPDAKVVPGITTKRERPSAPNDPKPRIPPKSPAELEALLEQCNAGDLTACNSWTRAGGPNSLREKERKAEAACESGSLADCEWRYCNGGASAECRAHALQAAKVAGDNWYLRNTGTLLPDGSTRYDVRCVPDGARIMRELGITCSGTAGPNRCTSPVTSLGYPRLDSAAAALCALRTEKVAE